MDTIDEKVAPTPVESEWRLSKTRLGERDLWQTPQQLEVASVARLCEILGIHHPSTLPGDDHQITHGNWSEQRDRYSLRFGANTDPEFLLLQLELQYETDPTIGAMVPSGQTMDLLETLIRLDRAGILAQLISADQPYVATVGPGAGIETLVLASPGMALANAVQQHGGTFLGPEYNSEVLGLAERNLKNNPQIEAPVHFRQSDLFEGVKGQEGMIAASTFNPPGVAIPMALYEHAPETAASISPYIGGSEADLQVKYIEQLGTMLGPRGVGFMVNSSRTPLHHLQQAAEAQDLEMLILSSKLFEYHEAKFEAVWKKAKSALQENAPESEANQSMPDSYDNKLWQGRDENDPPYWVHRIGDQEVKFEAYRVIAFVRRQG